MSGEFRSDIAFTKAVKVEQQRRGSRDGYQNMMQKHDWRHTVTPDLEAFVGQCNSFYLGTATAGGQPYIQHRGGPKGFLGVVDDTTLGFADFAGNRQYISIGNVAENDKAFIFLMNYENSSRVKLWGRLSVVEGDDALVEKLMIAGYKARPERVFLFAIEAWDTNCPQHIPLKFDMETVEAATSKLTKRIEELESELAKLKGTA